MTMRELREAPDAADIDDAAARNRADRDDGAQPRPSLALTAIRTIPWSVLIGYPMFFGSQALAAGAVLFALLMVPWVSVVGLSRRWQRRLATRQGRIGLTLAILTIAVVLLGFGGIVVVPAIAAFLALDVSDPGTPGARRRATLAFAAFVVIAAVSGGALAFFVFPAALTALLALLVPIPERADVVHASADAPDR